MKSITIKFHFDDEYYQELEELAENLGISTQELIAEFFNEGVALSWGTFEHKAKKKKGDARRQKIKLVKN